MSSTDSILTVAVGMCLPEPTAEENWPQVVACRSTASNQRGTFMLLTLAADENTSDTQVAALPPGLTAGEGWP
jgi:hypothetical protein